MVKRNICYRRFIQNTIKLYYHIMIPLTPSGSWKKAWRTCRKIFLCDKEMLDRNLKRFRKRYKAGKHDMRSYRRTLIDFLLCYILFCVTADEYFQYEWMSKGWLWRNHHVTIERRNYIDLVINDTDKTELLANKVEFNKFYDRYIGRKWCDLKAATAEEFEDLFSDNKRIIIKPRGRFGGVDIEAYDIDKTDLKKLHSIYLEKKGNYIAEEFLYQTGILHDINPDSLNTIRVTTLRDGNRIEILDGYYRCGCGSAVIDNFSGGGIIFPINIKNGKIYEGHSKSNIGIAKHPITGINVKGTAVPDWEFIIDSIKNVHRMTPKGIDLVGWDTCIINGKLILIEGNSKPGYTTLYDPKNKLWQKFKRRFK